MSELYTVESDGTVITTTQSGWTVECLPVGDLMLQVGSHLVYPDEPAPPTYTITGVGGETEERQHDAESIRDPKTSDEDRAAWDVYQDALREYETKTDELDTQTNEMRGTFINLEGMRVRGLPDDLKAWAANQTARYGFEIDTTTPDDLLLAFIGHNVIRTARDGVRIAAGILRASGLDQEALDQAERSFLDSLEGQQGRGNDSGDQDVSSE